MNRIEKHGRCIDIGCGSGPKRPAPDYDMYCDVIAPRPGVILPEPYVQCAMEDMSCFKDKEFDYARCHHVAEHVVDPDRAMSELQRIARSGVINTPPAQAEMQFGRKDHNWYVFIDRGRLLFIEKWHKSLGIPRPVTRCELNQDFYWQDSFEWQVVRVEQLPDDVLRRWEVGACAAAM
jgi:hypothetical protein